MNLYLHGWTNLGNAPRRVLYRWASSFGVVVFALGVAALSRLEGACLPLVIAVGPVALWRHIIATRLAAYGLAQTPRSARQAAQQAARAATRLTDEDLADYLVSEPAA